MGKVWQYEEQTGTLLIETQDGALLAYQNIPKFVFDALMASPLRGNYFQLNIEGIFDYKEIHRLN